MLHSDGVFMCIQENAWKEINQISTISISDTEIMAVFFKSLLSCSVCVFFCNEKDKIKRRATSIRSEPTELILKSLSFALVVAPAFWVWQFGKKSLSSGCQNCLVRRHPHSQVPMNSGVVLGSTFGFLNSTPTSHMFLLE